MRLMLLGLVLLGSFAGAARADEKGDQAFAAGQFVGAATVCGVPRPQVNALAKAMLDMFGVDSSGPGPEMTRFTEGVTAGSVEQRDHPQATCDEVKEGFGQMQDKLKPE